MLGTCIQDIVFERPVRSKGNLGIKTGLDESNATVLLSEELHRSRMKKLRCLETVTILLLLNVIKFKTVVITQNFAHNLRAVFLRIALVCLVAELPM